MFNHYIHERQTMQASALKDHTKSVEKALSKHKLTRDFLSKRYYSRLNNQLTHLLQEPDLPEEKPPASSSRSFLQSQGQHSQQQRIDQATEWNHWLDLSPSAPDAFQLRPRDKDKELYPPFNFRPKTGKQRLEEAISYQKQFFDSSYAPNKSMPGLYKDYSGNVKLRLSGGKEKLHYYHLKTNFKTYEHLAFARGSLPANCKVRPTDKGIDELSSMSKSVLHKFRIKPQLRAKSTTRPRLV